MTYEEWKKEFKEQKGCSKQTFRGMPAYLQAEKERLFCYPAPFIQQLEEERPVIQLKSVDYTIYTETGKDPFEMLSCLVYHNRILYQFNYEVKHTSTNSRGWHYVSPISERDKFFTNQVKSLLESFVHEYGYNRLSSLFHSN